MAKKGEAAKAKTRLKKTSKSQASPAETKHAEMLYCEKNWTPAAIADAMDKNIKTIYAWRDEGHWDDTREMFNISPTELKKQLIAAALRVAKGEKRLDAEGNELKEIDADALSKIMKAIDYMNKKASASVCRDVLMEFDNFLSGKEPQLAANMTQYHKMFLIHKIEIESGN